MILIRSYLAKNQEYCEIIADKAILEGAKIISIHPESSKDTTPLSWGDAYRIWIEAHEDVHEKISRRLSRLNANQLAGGSDSND
jgi:hypothetical protein